MIAPNLSFPQSTAASEVTSSLQTATPDVSVVVPTYGEAVNLPILVPRIHQALLAAGLRGEIIIVDDNSPDETVSVCERLAFEYPVRLEVRYHERGLAS